MPPMIQTLAVILYFYFFIVASVALTVYIVSTCLTYRREARKRREEP